MSRKTMTLAKSLHTVSALVALGSYLMAEKELLPADAVRLAQLILGYDPDLGSDPYGLTSRAVATLRGPR